MTGALRWDDLTKFCEEIGFTKPRLVSASYFDLQKEEIKQAVGRYYYTYISNNEEVVGLVAQ